MVCSSNCFRKIDPLAPVAVHRCVVGISDDDLVTELLENSRNPLTLGARLKQHARVLAPSKRRREPLDLRGNARLPDLAGRRDFADLTVDLPISMPIQFMTGSSPRRTARDTMVSLSDLVASCHLGNLATGREISTFPPPIIISMERRTNGGLDRVDAIRHAQRARRRAELRGEGFENPGSIPSENRHHTAAIKDLGQPMKARRELVALQLCGLALRIELPLARRLQPESRS